MISRNRPSGPGEEYFWRVFTIYVCGGHFGHVTSIMSSYFHFRVPESFHTKFGSDRHSSFWENPVWFFYVHNLWPRSRNDLDLQYSHIFICSIRCLRLLPFRSLAAIVSERSTVFTFFYRKGCYQIWLGRKIGQGHSSGSSFEQTMINWSPQY